MLLLDLVGQLLEDLEVVWYVFFCCLIPWRFVSGDETIGEENSVH